MHYQLTLEQQVHFQMSLNLIWASG